MAIFNKQQEAEIINAIKQAELGTSAEVKVHIDKKCPSNDPRDEAVKRFLSLKMEKTALRNGVLIYVAYGDKKAAIIGDKGINELVGEGFWDSTYQLMRDQFTAGQLCKGICMAIENVAIKLKEFFPYSDDDINELSDDISYGK